MRDALQEILAASLPDGTVSLGKRLSGASALAGGGVSCRFADGSEATHDVLVGCDGIGSALARIGSTDPTHALMITLHILYIHPLL